MSLKSFVGCLVAVLTFAACSKAKEEDLLASGNLPAVAGEGIACVNITDNSFGSDLNGTSYIRWLTLRDDGTYTYAILWASGSCATTSAANGDNFMTYAQSGIWTSSGTATSPTDAFNLEFTVGGAVLTVRPTLTKGTAAANYLNGRCGFGGSISTSGSSTTAINNSGQNCTADSTWSLPNFPAASLMVKNIVKITAPNAEFGARGDVWSPGQTSYPTSLTETYYGW